MQLPDKGIRGIIRALTQTVRFGDVKVRSLCGPTEKSYLEDNFSLAISYEKP